MKNKYKALMITGSIMAGAAVVNHAIFRANDKKPLSRFKEHNYKFKFGDINYTVLGEGEPLLLVHGVYVGATYQEWEKNIISLSKHYKVYAFDLLGFGASEKPAITYSPYLYVTLINSFIEDIIKTSPYVIASSTSCSLSTVASLFKTSNFKKLILVSPNITNCQEKSYSKYLSRIIELPIIGTSLYNIMSSKIQITKYLKNKVYYNPLNVTQNMINGYYHISHFRGSNVKYPVASFLGGYLDMNIMPYLEKVNVPIHIIWGRETEEDLAQNYSKLKNTNSNIDITIIDNCKLLPHSEMPKEFYRVVRESFR